MPSIYVYVYVYVCPYVCMCMYVTLLPGVRLLAYLPAKSMRLSCDWSVLVDGAELFLLVAVT
jgi:hypothetical protein